ncbi:alpha-L-fucosidase [Silvibacterium bohemicum]|uniref:alpha-L-fucosidase n=1 Tax=Silvibacterium bohemicum TaxID=1577686 RepID=A0A841JXE1_9BACT|nr:alpha-L-fucosidase [Silvibacterium bohemicum]MBB6143108.1 alpha-L-fucosidase [Silvibacterium bohemicum]
MTTRRDFLRIASETSAFTILANNSIASAHPMSRGSIISSAIGTTAARPLLELQQRFVDLRFGMFVHFNMATFQDREWGDPTSAPSLFHPTALDTDQWAAAAQSAQMTWGCLTTRHHDGFCLWPTRTNGTSVRQAQPGLDVVRRYVDSFRKAGLRVGLYYSILSLRDDIRHFNVTPGKVRLIKYQLTELMTQYGEIDVLITDGWNAPWSRITYEEVPFREIYDLVKSHQPNCLICDLNASQFPTGGLYYSDIKAFEQNAGQKVPQDSDLPALACVTLTDGWFWKQADLHGRIKPTETVVDQWLVPLNQRHCNLILNAPPTREGRLAPNILASLEEIGKVWKKPPSPEPLTRHVGITTPNLATGKPIHASSYPDGVGPDQANDGNFHSSWYAEKQTSCWLEVDLVRPERFNTLSLIEPVAALDNYQQSRIRNYRFEALIGSDWAPLASGGTPAPTTILRLPKPIVASKLRLTIEASTPEPHIADIGIYNEPA